jgi:hypothetical protein
VRVDGRFVLVLLSSGLSCNLHVLGHFQYSPFFNSIHDVQLICFLFLKQLSCCVRFILLYHFLVTSIVFTLHLVNMPPTNLQKYSTLSSINEVPFDIEEQTHHEQDAADDSDTTLASSSFLQTSKSRSPSPKSRRSHHRDTSSRRKGLFTWIRWVVVVLLQSVIILLLLQGNGYLDTNSGKWDEKMTETGGDINGLYVPSKSLSEHTYPSMSY